MMKKKYLLIIVIVLFLSLLTFFKFGNKKEETKEHYFVSSEIKVAKKDDETNVNDEEKYFDYIIQDNLTSIDYMFFDASESIKGEIYIGDDKKLYISDENKNKVHLISSIKFKTMYLKDYEYENGIYLTLISEDNKLYSLGLDSNNIEDVNIFDYRWKDKFINFVDIDYEHDMYVPANAIFAITEEGKIYNVNAGLRYDERTISLYSNFYVFHDNTMTNSIGNLITNKEGKRYKIKNIFIIQETNDFIDDECMYVIITEENEFLYLKDDMTFVYEFDKKVKDIKFDSYYPYVNGNLEIIFEDNYKMNFTATCNEYFCINEFAE